MSGSGFPLGYLIIFVPFILLLSLATGSPAVTVKVEVVSIGTSAEMEEAGQQGLEVGDVIDLDITEDNLNRLEKYPDAVVCLTWDDIAIANAPTDELADCGEPIEVILVSSP